LAESDKGQFRRRMPFFELGGNRTGVDVHPEWLLRMGFAVLWSGRV
jgi:hypothetical protein